MKTMANAKVFSLGLVCALLAVSPASYGQAEPPDAEANSVETRAKTLREEGLAHFDRKQYLDAVQKFQMALALQRTAGAMAQMASALNELQRYDEALQTYETVLKEFPNISTELRKMVTDELSSLVAKVGTIAVEGDVIAGARLFIDNRDVGVLPLPGPVRVLGGVHQVRAEKHGFPPIVASVMVRAGKPSVANLVARERKGTLDVREKHNWIVRVEMDGRDVGVTPWVSPVDVGEHRIRLRGFMPQDALIACEMPTQEVSLGVRMESVERVIRVDLYDKQSLELSVEDMDTSFRVDSTPSRATLRIDGRDYGKTAWEGRLPLGKHVVEVGAPGFVTEEQTVFLERRKQQVLGVRLDRIAPPPGFWTARTVSAGAGFGVGMLGIGLSVVTGGIAWKTGADLKEACVAGLCPGAKEEDLDRARVLSNAAFAGLIAGAVGGVTGSIILLATKPAKKDSPSTRSGLVLDIGPGGFFMTTTF